MSLDESTTRKISQFLFDKFDGKEKISIDTRTDIQNEEIFKTLTYYRILESLGSKKAGEIADIIERLLLSIDRKARNEAVSVLVGGELPKTEKMYVGAESLLEESEEE